MWTEGWRPSCPNITPISQLPHYGRGAGHPWAWCVWLVPAHESSAPCEHWQPPASRWWRVVIWGVSSGAALGSSGESYGVREILKGIKDQTWRFTVGAMSVRVSQWIRPDLGWESRRRQISYSHWEDSWPPSQEGQWAQQPTFFRVKFTPGHSQWRRSPLGTGPHLALFKLCLQGQSQSSTLRAWKRKPQTPSNPLCKDIHWCITSV